MPEKLRILLVALVLALLVPAHRALAQPLTSHDPARGEERLVVFGDFNGPYGSVVYPAAVARVVDAIGETWRPDLVLLPGDLVAGQDASLPDERFAEMWAAFDAAVAARLRSYDIPYAAAIGNHDGSSLRAAGDYAFARERDAAATYWSQPMYDRNLAYVERDAFPFAYAFRHGRLFVAVVDASGPHVDDEARAWLRDALAGPAATAAEARIVMGHLPLFGIAVGRDRAGEVVADGAALARLLEEGDVDAYVSGHHAAYYPGRHDGLELLFAGGIGARRLVGTAAPPRSTVTLVDLWFEPLRVRYTTFDVADGRVVRADDLPERIDAFGGTVVRSERGGP